MLPKDPMILLSVINTKLRDNYKSLKELCDDMNEDEERIKSILKEYDFTYDDKKNKFI